MTKEQKIVLSIFLSSLLFSCVYIFMDFKNAYDFEYIGVKVKYKSKAYRDDKWDNDIKILLVAIRDIFSTHPDFSTYDVVNIMSSTYVNIYPHDFVLRSYRDKSLKPDHPVEDIKKWKEERIKLRTGMYDQLDLVWKEVPVCMIKQFKDNLDNTKSVYHTALIHEFLHRFYHVKYGNDDPNHIFEYDKWIRFIKNRYLERGGSP